MHAGTTYSVCPCPSIRLPSPRRLTCKCASCVTFASTIPPIHHDHGCGYDYACRRWTRPNLLIHRTRRRTRTCSCQIYIDSTGVHVWVMLLGLLHGSFGCCADLGGIKKKLAHFAVTEMWLSWAYTPPQYDAAQWTGPKAYTLIYSPP
ncbi:hypothetical protein BKA82DRAFT_733598 [Pisolithus tinctorius]|uniref:Uncharacterized protein n=1 Tax=Pisolithus tinctorius Marx 270 TaxID=870435 RepID=A0A0C3IX94_PISTI|nr:hypothetical protein BKA82DRAFT_733598 [Pisolithus tinctorius]KIO01438.1 hypothetical protein M404DRAFT_733598 [Pisolithus tinctorius Marx 270]